MNYLKIYKKLMIRASKRELEEGYEKHHILPESLLHDENAQKLLGKIKVPGKDTKCVKLTYREHLLVHLLLVKLFEKISKNCYQRMLFAANMMRTTRGGVFTLNPVKYAWLRERFVGMMRVKGKGHPSGASGKKWSEEAKKAKSDNHPAKGKTYEEYYGEKEAKRLKEIRSKSSKGRVTSEETKKKQSIVKKNISDETRSRMSRARKGKPMHPDTYAKLMVFSKNDELNPHVDQTLYEFVNKNTGETVFSRMIDMRKKYGCSTISNVVRGKSQSSRGWVYTGRKK